MKINANLFNKKMSNINSATERTQPFSTGARAMLSPNQSKQQKEHTHNIHIYIYNTKRHKTILQTYIISMEEGACAAATRSLSTTRRQFDVSGWGVR